MKMALALFLTCCVSASGAERFSIESVFPGGAQIIESKDISKLAHKPRLLVLWMAQPVEKRSSDPVSCPAVIYGDYWLGAAKLSVVDISAKKVVSSIDIEGSGAGQLIDSRGGRLTAIPFQFPSPTGGEPSRAHLLDLKDFTGEGRDAQFPLFGYFACGQTDTSLLGYDVDSDRPVQYPVMDDADASHLWVPNLFSHSPAKPGYFDVRWGWGHGSTETHHTVAYFDATHKRFTLKDEVECESGEASCR